jgi:prepilin peptidase CpaA
MGVFLILYLMGGMGAGDVKLMGAAGAFLGAKGVAIAATISVLIGLAYAIVLLFIHMDYARSSLRRIVITVKTFFVTREFIPIPRGKDEIQPKLSFGIPIALGTMSYVVLKITGSKLIQDLLGVPFSI